MRWATSTTTALRRRALPRLTRLQAHILMAWYRWAPLVLGLVA